MIARVEATRNWTLARALECIAEMGGIIDQQGDLMAICCPRPPEFASWPTAVQREWSLHNRIEYVPAGNADQLARAIRRVWANWKVSNR